MSESQTSKASKTPFTRREFLKRSAVAAALPGVSVEASAQSGNAQSQTSRRPNVVIIHADQFRWDVLGAYGLNPMGLTPNLDAMAKRGTLFQSAITNQPVCAPSRACLWTGQYPAMHGVWRNGIGLRTDAQTIATAFRQAGYTANYVGKWHLAAHTTGPVTPEHRGGFLDFWEASNVLEFTSHPYEGDIYDTEGKPIHYSGIYRVDFMTQRAVRFLREKAHEPFLLAVSYIEPHYQNDLVQFVGPKGSEQRYANPFVPKDLRFFPGDWPSQLPGYYGCVASIDEAVGTILRTLSELGLEKNTIVAFTSDHGCHFRTRNTEYKRSAHESSIHVPLVVQGPGFNRSLAVPQLVGMVDIAPTLLASAGVPIPDSMQGRSAMPVLQGKTDEWRNEVFIQMSEFAVGRVLRTEQWTYAVASPKRNASHITPVPQSEISKQHKNYNLTEGSRPAPYADRYVEYQMYDLYSDPHQLVNMAGRNETLETAVRLRGRLKERIAEAGDHSAEIDSPYFPYP
jgi:arylsulfatase A-like enzyme